MKYIKTFERFDKYIMNHLKKFNEELSDLYFELKGFKDNLKDIALELEDEGLLVKVEDGYPYGSRNPQTKDIIMCRISIYDGVPVKLTPSILDTLLRMFDYMGANDFYIDGDAWKGRQDMLSDPGNNKFLYTTQAYNNLLLTRDRIETFSSTTGGIERSFREIAISFSRDKLNRTNETKEQDIVSNLHDITIELEDEGFEISSWSGANLKAAGNKGFIPLEITYGEKKEWAEYSPSHEFTDNVVDTLLRIIDYMKGENYVINNMTFRNKYTTYNLSVNDLTVRKIQALENIYFKEIFILFEFKY